MNKILLFAMCALGVVSVNAQMIELVDKYLPPQGGETVYLQGMIVTPENRQVHEPLNIDDLLTSGVVNENEFNEIKMNSGFINKIFDFKAYKGIISRSELVNMGDGIFRNRNCIMFDEAAAGEGGTWKWASKNKISIEQFAAEVPENSMFAIGFTVNSNFMYETFTGTPGMVEYWTRVIEEHWGTNVFSGFNVKEFMNAVNERDIIIYGEHFKLDDSDEFVISVILPIEFEQFKGIAGAALKQKDNGFFFDDTIRCVQRGAKSAVVIGTKINVNADGAKLADSKEFRKFAKILKIDKADMICYSGTSRFKEMIEALDIPFEFDADSFSKLLEQFVVVEIENSNVMISEVARLDGAVQNMNKVLMFSMLSRFCYALGGF